MSLSSSPTECFDVIVVGGGHAGCEATITAARLGLNTALFTLNLDRIAWKPCNPAIGGPAKSQLVHKVDALGGVIGRLADATAIQKRVLNASRGLAVWALRAQTDKSSTLWHPNLRKHTSPQQPTNNTPAHEHEKAARLRRAGPTHFNS